MANRPIFADTDYWLGFLIPGDELGQRAQSATARYGPRRIITSELVLVEVLDGMSRRGAYLRRQAVELVERLRNDPEVDIVPVDSSLVEAAVGLYGSRLDQRWSLTDCVSFLIMESRNIWQALSHDRDFAAAGFVALLRDN